MEIKFEKSKIEIEKELNALDKFTLRCVSILNKLRIKYVVVSGYVSILFGRNRSSEDIDLIIEKVGIDKFKQLFLELESQFECIITSKAEEAYTDYLLENHSIRFSEKGKFIPNIEIKFPKTELDEWSLENSLEVRLNGDILFISRIELQIPFKLFLGSEKDIEDAKFLYRIFKGKLDENLLQEFNRKLNIGAVFDKYIK